MSVSPPRAADDGMAGARKWRKGGVGNKLRRVAGTVPLAKADPLAAYSLTALLEARERLVSGADYKARNRKRTKASLTVEARKKYAATIRKRTREKQKALREAIAAKAPRRRFDGTRERKALVPPPLALVAAWPDRAATILEARERCPSIIGAFGVRLLGRARDQAVSCGWLVMVESGMNKGARYLNQIGSGRCSARSTYRLTVEGRAVRSWAWWVAARAMLGWPLPVTGNQCRLVRYWIRGDADAIRAAILPAVEVWSANPDRSTGYLPGQVPDDAWPDMGRIALPGARRGSQAASRG